MALLKGTQFQSWEHDEPEDLGNLSIVRYLLALSSSNPQKKPDPDLLNNLSSIIN